MTAPLGYTLPNNKHRIHICSQCCPRILKYVKIHPDLVHTRFTHTKCQKCNQYIGLLSVADEINSILAEIYASIYSKTDSAHFAAQQEAKAILSQHHTILYNHLPAASYDYISIAAKYVLLVAVYNYAVRPETTKHGAGFISRIVDNSRVREFFREKHPVAKNLPPKKN